MLTRQPLLIEALNAGQQVKPEEAKKERVAKARSPKEERFRRAQLAKHRGVLTPLRAGDKKELEQLKRRKEWQRAGLLRGPEDSPIKKGLRASFRDASGAVPGKRKKSRHLFRVGQEEPPLGGARAYFR